MEHSPILLKGREEPQSASYFEIPKFKGNNDAKYEKDNLKIKKHSKSQMRIAENTNSIFKSGSSETSMIKNNKINAKN